jgi:hypothetical protein
MKKCSYCGGENDDGAVNCKGCGSDMRPPGREPEPDKKNHARSAPIFGTIAISAPVSACLLALLVGHYSDPHDLGAYYAAGAALLSGLILGGFSGLLALARKKRYRALSLVALVVNFGPVLCLLVRALLRHLEAG